jgi:hypothetical protein
VRKRESLLKLIYEKRRKGEPIGPADLSGEGQKQVRASGGEHQSCPFCSACSSRQIQRKKKRKIRKAASISKIFDMPVDLLREYYHLIKGKFHAKSAESAEDAGQR